MVEILSYSTPFHVHAPFRNPLKTLENQVFFDIFRGYRNNVMKACAIISIVCGNADTYLVTYIYDGDFFNFLLAKIVKLLTTFLKEFRNRVFHRVLKARLHCKVMSSFWIFTVMLKQWRRVNLCFQKY